MATVLLIDAEKEFAEPISQAIRGFGYDCTWVTDGKDGLDKAGSEHPDAIVLCVELPKMSGYSICNKLKKDESLKNIPLIITSREATHETFEQHKKLKSLDLMEPGGEEDIVLDDLPAGAKEETFGADDIAGNAPAMDPLDALEGLTIADEEDEAPEATRIMKMPSPEELAKLMKAPAAKAPAPAPVETPKPAPAAPVAAAKPAPVSSASAKPVGDSERAQIEAKLQEARTKASASAQEVDKLRAEMNQLRTKSREETAALRKQVQELEGKLKGEQTELKARYEESTQKALQEAEKLRQQVKDTQTRAQQEMEQLRTQLIEMRNQSQDLLTQRDAEASGAQAKVGELQAALESLKTESSRAQKVRERTQKAVDVALQLLQEAEGASSEDAA